MFYYSLFFSIPFLVMAKIKHIVISGGGAAGFAFYGSLKHSQERGLWNIKDIESIYSTSAGSMISVFIALGYDWNTLDDYIIKRPWNQVFKFELPMAVQAIKNQGLFSASVIQETFTPLFHGKDIPLDVNLADFYKINQKELHFITTDYNTFDYVDVSYKTHPNWKVVDAIYASCALPILFSPFYKQEDDTAKVDVYLDGGIRMNYPLHVCLEDGCDPAEILGIRRTDPLSNVQDITTSFTLFDIMHRLFHQYTRKIEINMPETQIRYQYDVIFNCMDLNAIFHSLSSEEERIRLIQYGVQSSLENSSTFVDPSSSIDSPP